MSTMSEVKVKKERLSNAKRVKRDTIPVTKSSTEILSELFGVFNAEPPQISEIIKIEKHKKSKKSKSKRKHKKEKKKKKRKKHSGSSENSNDDVAPQSKKRRKVKLERVASSDSISINTPPLTPEIKNRSIRFKTQTSKLKRDRNLATTADKQIKVKYANIQVKVKNDKYEKKEKLEMDIPIPLDPDLSRISLPGETDAKKENSNSDGAEKSKRKIQIKSLKFSTVFVEAVKQAEEVARKKAEKYEEGELLESLSESSSKTEDENMNFPKSSYPGGLSSKLNENALTKDKSGRRSSSIEKEKINKTGIKTVDSLQRSRSKTRKRSHKKSHSRSYSRRSRSRSRHRSKHRSRSRHHSKSRHHSRNRHRSRSRHGSRSRYHSKDRHRSRSRHGSRSKHTSRTRHRSTSKNRHNSRRSRSRSRGLAIDKKRLLEIARRNALQMLRGGGGQILPPAAAGLGPQAQQKVISAIKAGGKSVDELTDFCKNLSKKEAMGELSSLSSNESDLGSENEDAQAFHHPFLVKEKAPIVMNIRGGTALPTKKAELSMQFPVSSGNDHRGLEWRPVSPQDVTAKAANKSFKPAPKAPLALPPCEPSTVKSQQAIQPPLPLQPQQAFVNPPAVPVLPPPLALMPAPAAAPGPQAYPPGMQNSPEQFDIGSLVSERLSALRRQTDTPEQLGWHGVNKLGQFTGTTGAQILTPRELASGSQAWVKKDQLVKAAPVAGGLGMTLLQKMGWQPGRGLGKEGTGALTPLLLEVKLDTKGLVAKEELRPARNVKRNVGIIPTANAQSSSTPTTHVGKHPVSLLGEYCSKRKLGAPSYQLCFECGPDHKKNFLFKVRVNGIEYQPSLASVNKKQAKADSAMIALQNLGIVP